MGPPAKRRRPGQKVQIEKQEVDRLERLIREGAPAPGTNPLAKDLASNSTPTKGMPVSAEMCLRLTTYHNCIYYCTILGFTAHCMLCRIAGSFLLSLGYRSHRALLQYYHQQTSLFQTSLYSLQRGCAHVLPAASMDRCWVCRRT
jgi:hypothetical protein